MKENRSIPAPKKVSRNNLRQWLNVELKRFHTDYEVNEIYTANYGRFSKGDWSNKTCISIRHKNNDMLIFSIRCIWFMNEINSEIKHGGELKLIRTGKTMSDLELIVEFPTAAKHKGPPR